MNRYTIAELAVGHSERFEVLVTDEMLAQFLAITGDCNPLHIDAAYAKEKGYADRVVYGMLVAGFYSTLCGVYLPGERSLLHEVKTKFKRPVFAGDRLTIIGTVAQVSEGLGRIEIKAKILNQNGEVVNTAAISAGVV